MGNAAGFGMGATFADYDGNGDLDLAVSVNRGRPLLFRNDTTTEHHSLAVRSVVPRPGALARRWKWKPAITARYSGTVQTCRT